ncbi:MAG: serine/threonine protein kinase [Bradymonadia bacterium]|jgi:serine/threonine protein kinase
MDGVVVCRICGQAWTGAQPGGRCPNGDGGVLVGQPVHEKFYNDSAIGYAIAGKYAVIDKLGEGGFGSVYRAIQEPVGRTVAVKVIASGEASDEELRGRFFREARVVSRLSNRATVTLHDYGQDDDGTLFMVFEYIAGQVLADLVADNPNGMPAQQAVDIVLQVLGALAEAHAIGLVHRDLKPGNIMVTTDARGTQEVKVLDFGIAKLQEPDDLDDVRTREGVVLGTPRYMSPEQSQDAVLDGRSDLYAMGVILYELLSGYPPFTGAVPFDILLAHIQKPVPPLNSSLQVPAALEAVVRTVLSKTPDGRYASAEAMIEALKTAMGPPSGSMPGVSSVNVPVAQFTPQTMVDGPAVDAYPSFGGATAPNDIVTGDVLPPKSGKSGLLITLLVLALAGGGFAGWYFLLRPPAVAPAPAKPPVPDGPPVTVSFGKTTMEPAKACAQAIKLAKAGHMEDAGLALKGKLSLASNVDAILAYAATQPDLAEVLVQPALAEFVTP